MKLNDPEDINFKRRNLVIGVGQLAVFGLLLSRLQYLQIIRGDIYKDLAEANRVDVRSFTASRGVISDRHGVLLADNSDTLGVDITAEQSPNVEKTLVHLARILNLSEERQADILREISRNPSFRPIAVSDNLDWESFARLNLELPHLAGVTPHIGNIRRYHYAKSSAHLVGYVGAKTARDIEIFGDSPASRVGKNGIERTYEEILRGKAGVQQMEVNARGRTVRELAYTQSNAGNDIRLTIDIRAQDYARSRLEQHSGSVVVMDVNTGEIITLISSPTYDSNDITGGMDNKAWQTLLRHEQKPLLNKALSGLYAPGSTFKMIVTLAALEKGVINPEERIHCGGSFELGEQKFHCWEQDGHGEMDLENAIAQSCDVYFYDIALRTGIEAIAEMARRFGFGVPTNIDLGDEKHGQVPGKEWKRATYGNQWKQGETAITGIGQGFLLATPLQLAYMGAMLANGARPFTPFLATVPDANFDEQGVVAKEHLSLVQKALYSAVNHERGTAHGSSFLWRGKRMAGKTGTVQVRHISQAERDDKILTNAELPWQLRDHALFVGYAPHDVPRYAMAVVIEHGGSGSAVAAPIARDIMRKILSLNPAPRPFMRSEQIT